MTALNTENEFNAQILAEWYEGIGVDEVIADEPVNRLKPLADSMGDVVSAAQSQIASLDNKAQPQSSEPLRFTPPRPNADDTPPLGTAEAVSDALRIAKDCKTLDDLYAAITEFDGCMLKRLAQSPAIFDGNAKARIMLLGEVASSDDDKTGKPFSGAAGQLLDKMFDAIGLNRGAEASEKSLYISHMVPWRPPGNRMVSDSDISICRPFVMRHIELVKPEVLVLLGGVTTKAILETSKGITRMRGKFTTLELEDGTSIKTLPMLHPAFLMTSPDRKREAWQDLLMLKDSLGMS